MAAESALHPVCLIRLPWRRCQLPSRREAFRSCHLMHAGMSGKRKVDLQLVSAGWANQCPLTGKRAEIKTDFKKKAGLEFLLCISKALRSTPFPSTGSRFWIVNTWCETIKQGESDPNEKSESTFYFSNSCAAIHWAAAALFLPPASTNCQNKVSKQRQVWGSFFRKEEKNNRAR